MAAAAPPAMRITIRPGGADKAFRFEGGGRSPIEVGTGSSLERFLRDRSRFRDRLEAFKHHGDTLDVPWKGVAPALADLKRLASRVIDGMLDVDIRRLPEIYAMFDAAFLSDRVAGRTPIVQITASTPDPVYNAVPFELLQVRQPPASEAVTNHAAMGETLDSFLGFAAILARNLGPAGSAADLAAPHGRLPIRVFYNAELKSAAAEVAFFQENRSRFDFDGPWPAADVGPPGAAEIVGGHLIDPARTLGEKPRDTPDQVQHFACHCDTFGDSEDNSITLGSSKELQHKISLGDLIEIRVRAAGVGKLCDGDMPLVFLNACGSASIDPLEVGSFVRFFLVNRNRGFIGAQTLVPDTFAARFGKAFYLDLIDRRATVGEAMYNTRRTLANRHRNPIGILYMHFGRAELRLR